MAFLEFSYIALTNLILQLLLISYFLCFGNASQRYPYVLPKCCKSDGSPFSDGATIRSCGKVASILVLLPRQLFPAMATDSDHVEVELRNLVGGLKCDSRQPRYNDIDLTHLQASRLVRVGMKEAFDGVAFSGDNLLAPDGHIYAPRHFCISSRTINKTHLAIKTCKRTCSLQRPCIRRCCGGHQSILTSPPTSATDSILGFCSSPLQGDDSWNPWTSKILQGMHHESLFLQTSYAPPFVGVDGQPIPLGNCHLLRFTETPLTLLRDGSLMFPVKAKTGQTKNATEDNFCIDGINGVAEGKFFSTTGDKCEASEEKEVVIAYVCSHKKGPSVSTELVNMNKNDIISLPVCLCLASVLERLIPFPLSSQRNLGVFPLVILAAGDNGVYSRVHNLYDQTPLLPWVVLSAGIHAESKRLLHSKRVPKCSDR